MKKQFEKDGYILVKDVFTDEEVKSFRDGCQLNEPGDAVCRPQFLNIAFMPKVVNVIKELLGPDISYPATSVSWTRAGYHKVPRGFHSDFVGVDDFSHEYPIINVACYLQDYAHNSDGLKIIPGSHNKQCLGANTFKDVIKFLLKGKLAYDLSKSVNIPSTERDLVVWYARVHHSGRFKRLKFFDISVNPILENWIPSFLCKPVPKERDAVVMKWGKTGPIFDDYVSKQSDKARRKEFYQANACFETEEIKNLAKQVGVTVRNDGYLALK